MRWLIQIAPALLLSANLVSAQAPEQKKVEAPPELTEKQKAARLDEILAAWEKRMGEVKNLSMLVTQTRIEPVRQEKEIFKGTANFQKPNLANLHLANSKDEKDFRRYIIGPNAKDPKVYAYDSSKKVILEFDVSPASKFFITDNLFFVILSGLKEKEAKERFDFKYQKEVGPYAYIDLTPKRDGDKRQFSVARLTFVIDKQYADSFMLPAQIHYLTPSNESFTYELQKIKVNLELPAKLFEPEVPQGWKLIPAEKVPMPPQNPKATESGPAADSKK